MIPFTRLFLVTLLFASLSLAGCGGSGGGDDQLAQERVTALLEDLKAQRFDDALERYSDEFFKAHSPEEWRGRLQSLTGEYGAMDRYLLRSKQSDPRFSGKFYIFEYESVHENGRLQHVITFIWPINEDDLKLVAHRITPR